jgi:hypothetical protein
MARKMMKIEEEGAPLLVSTEGYGVKRVACRLEAYAKREQFGSFRKASRV